MRLPEERDTYASLDLPADKDIGGIYTVLLRKLLDLKRSERSHVSAMDADGLQVMSDSPRECLAGQRQLSLRVSMLLAERRSSCSTPPIQAGSY